MENIWTRLVHSAASRSEGFQVLCFLSIKSVSQINAERVHSDEALGRCYHGKKHSLWCKPVTEQIRTISAVQLGMKDSSIVDRLKLAHRTKQNSFLPKWASGVVFNLDLKLSALLTFNQKKWFFSDTAVSLSCCSVVQALVFMLTHRSGQTVSQNERGHAAIL